MGEANERGSAVAAKAKVQVRAGCFGKRKGCSSALMSLCPSYLAGRAQTAR